MGISHMHIILSHNADPDGIISATLLSSVHRETQPQLRFADYPDLEEAMATILVDKPSHLIASDLPFREHSITDSSLIAVMEHGLSYFDHHPLSPERRQLLLKGSKHFVYTETPQCTSKLVCAFYQLGTDEQYMARVAQALDYPGSETPDIDALSAQLNWVIRPESGLTLVDIVTTLQKNIAGNTWQKDGQLTGSLRESYENIMHLADAARAKLESSITTHTVGNYKAVCACSPQLLYMKEGLKTLRNLQPDADIHTVFYESVSMIADATKVPVEKLPLLPYLKSKGGGGRQNGGGFTYKTPTTSANYAERRDQFLEDLKAQVPQ